jgi:outer membrane lipoprotein-sorting protein
LGPQSLFTQETAATGKIELPSGESIMDKQIEVTGGIDAYKKLKNIVIKGTFEAPGMKADITVYKAEPNLMLSETTIPGMGKILEGVDGKIAWSYNAVQGAVIKKDEMAELAFINAHFREEEWRAKITKAETIGIETVEGEECYRVLLTPKVGDVPSTNYYSRKTGFLVRTDLKVKLPMGEFNMQMIQKDYKKVGDLIMAHTIIQKMAGQEMKMSHAEIQFNVDIPKTTFEPPAEVKALLK